MRPSLLFPALATALLGASPLLAEDGARSAPAPEPEADQPGVPVQLHWSDLDGDGLEDALALAPSGELALFLNRGDGRFDEATMAAGLAHHGGVQLVLCADFDGDELADLYLGSATGQPKLLRNLGRLAFEELSAGIEHESIELAAAALDYDRDGRLDLHVTTAAGERLYHNLGQGRFERVELPVAGLAPGAVLRAAGLLPELAAAPLDAGEGGSQEASAGPNPGRRALSAPSPLGGAASSAATFSGAGTSGAGTSLPMLVSCGLAAAAAGNLVDQAGGSNCIQASSVPTLDMLYPMSADLNVSPAGNVGIGTPTPTAKLHVRGSNSGLFRVLDNAPSGGEQLLGEWRGNNAGPLVRFLNGANQYDIGQDAGGNFVIRAGSVVRVAVGTGGEFGVGVASPASRLHVQCDNGNSFFVHDTPATGGVHVLGEWEANGARPQVRYRSVGASLFDVGLDADGKYVIEADDVPRLTVEAGGNVGIGVSLPTSKLHVGGSTQVDGALNVGGTTLLQGDTAIDGGLILTSGLGLFLSGWDVSSFQGRLEINETNVATRLALEPGGNLGVGTQAPQARLHVAGDSRFDGDARVNGLLSVDSNLRVEGTNGSLFRVVDFQPGNGTQLVGELVGAGAGPQMRFGGAGGGFMDIGQDDVGNFVVESSDDPALAVTVGGNVAVGTTTPNGDHELTVKQPGDTDGTIVVDSGAAASQYSEIRLSDRGAARWSLNKRPDNNFGIDQPGINTFLEIQSFTGNVGIGTSPTSSKLSVNGDLVVNANAFKPGGGSWSVLSDRRKKHDIQDLEGALERLLALRGTTYRYNDPEELGAAAGVHTGFIAQEVEEVFPDWVSEDPNGTKLLSIRGFEALAVESLRELEEENAALRRRVERLESLEAQVAEMQATLQAMSESR